MGAVMTAAPTNRVDTPKAGYYKMRLVKGGTWVGVKLWHGPPHDPWSGAILDRSWRWQALVDGKEGDPFETWIRAAGHPIDEAEYRYLLAHSEWAKVNAPDLAPDRAVNHHTMKPIF